MDVPLGFVPFAFVLLCPLMMVLMMWGMHGGHGRKDQSAHGGSAGDAVRRAGLEADLPIDGR